MLCARGRQEWEGGKMDGGWREEVWGWGMRWKEEAKAGRWAGSAAGDDDLGRRREKVVAEAWRQLT